MTEQQAAIAQPGSGAEHTLRRLEWTVLRRLDGLLQGDFRTLMRGAGVDLAELREYQLHDDVRHIDWNVTARLQQPYVRQFLEDRDLTAWFLLDLSGSMRFGSGQKQKSDLSHGFVAALARLLTRHGNRVGALIYSGEIAGADARAVPMLPPGATRQHVLTLMHHLEQAARMPLAQLDASAQRKPWWRRLGRSAAPKAAAAQSKGTELANLLHAARAVIKRRSVVFVVSDFVSAPGWETALKHLAQKHDVLAVRVLDPAEQNLPDMGLVTVQDAETGEQLFIDASDEGFRARYAQAAKAADAALAAALHTSGADVLELATDDDLLEALLRYVNLRRQRARLPAGRRMPAAFSSRPVSALATRPTEEATA